MKLQILLNDIDVKVYGEHDLEVYGIADDSRKVSNGYLFVAIPGFGVDGHDYISYAIEAGAIVIVGEKKPEKDWLDRTTYVRVKNSRYALSILASNWFENPSAKMKMIGVTGTDGKTTTANIIYEILLNAGKEAALISTISAKIGGTEYDTGFHVTNPEPLSLYKFLRKAVDHGSEYCVLEVTSHGLHQARVDAIDFDIAVITNITHEHLDYHKSFEEYRKVKSKLFVKAQKLAVLNKDDDSFAYLLKRVRKGVKVMSFSTNRGADAIGSIQEDDGRSMTYRITLQGDSLQGTTNLVGEYNLQNILAAVSATKYYNIDNKIIIEALQNIEGLKGRMEEIKNDKGIRIIVDFAHTPNSLKKILTELRKSSKGKLISVFGCAGERDVQKRQLMPGISIGIADLSIFTAEDPRNEDVHDILSEMEKAAKDAGGKNLRNNDSIHCYKNRNCYTLIPERGDAIFQAINRYAKRGDTVAILGKGHEKSMAYGGVEYPWTDQEAVAVAMSGKIKKLKRK